jgi:hypothetical protein
VGGQRHTPADLRQERERERDGTFFNLGFVVLCILKYSNKTPNQMQKSVVKFIA